MKFARRVVGMITSSKELIRLALEKFRSQRPSSLMRNSIVIRVPLRARYGEKDGLAEVLGLFFFWVQVARNEVSVADVGQWGFFLSADVSYV